MSVTMQPEFDYCCVHYP